MEFSSKLKSCIQSPMVKLSPYADAAAAKGMKIYHLNVGQPDIETPESFFEAIRNFKAKTLGYCPPQGIGELSDAIIDYYKNINVSLNRKNVLITYGGSEALQMTITAILNDGDNVLVAEPFYQNYETFVTLAGGSLRPIPTCPEEGYRYAEREKIEKCITPQTKAIIINNPGNPTGIVLSEDELRLLASICKEHDMILIADEVYREFIYNDQPLSSVLQLEGFDDNVVVVDSVSKRFSACGARVGCMITRNEELLDECMKWCQGRICVSTLDQIGSAALYRNGSDYFEKVREEYKERRDTLIEGLKKIPGIILSDPQGAFYVMAKLPVDNAEKFQIWLLEEFNDNGETVMMTPVEKFYLTEGMGKNEVRIAYVINKNDIVRCCEILKKAIEEYNSL